MSFKPYWNLCTLGLPEEDGVYDVKIRLKGSCLNPELHTRLEFKNGEWVSYNLGKIDTIVGRADGSLTFEKFKKQIFKSFKDRLYTPDADKDIELDYTEEEKCSSVGGAGFHERK